MVIRYPILAKRNNLRKQLQYESMSIDETMSSVRAIIEFFRDYCENEFEKALDCARAITSNVGIDQVFI